MPVTVDITVARAPAGFDRWDALLALILDSFAFMAGVIDPPSSALRLTPRSLAEKAKGEILLLASEGDELLGCAFLAPRPDCLYLGKQAIRTDRQRAGIGRALMCEAERIARERGTPTIELQTRVELAANHRTFAALGFARTGESAHEGYARPTSITMRKVLAADG